MKKSVCWLLLICILVSHLALAETAAVTQTPSLGDVFAAAGLELPDRGESIEALNREIQDAMGVSAGTGFQPGMRLFTLLGMLGDRGLATRFDMPQDVWGQLWFMLDQGLAQYALTADAQLYGDENMPGSASVHAEIDAGMDNDRCFALDGNVRTDADNGDGTLITDGDGMYIRYNQESGDQRVKLPFVDEVFGQAQTEANAPEDQLAQMLSASFVKDADHWARAIDIVYERIAGQPEFGPLMRYAFEGASAPQDYVLTMQELVAACDRLLKDLSCDPEFIEEISNTALMDVIVQSYNASDYYNKLPDPAQMTAGQRKMLLFGAMSMAATALEELDRTQLPEGELRLHDGRVTLSYSEYRYSGRGYDNRLNFSYQPTQGGFALRATLMDSGETYQFAWSSGAPYDHHLSYSLSDGSEVRGVVTLDTDQTGFRFDLAADPFGAYAETMSLEVRKAGQGGYEITGHVGSGGRVYRLSGRGDAENGVIQGDFAITCADAYSPQYEMPVFDASYQAGNGMLNVYYNMDTGATGASYPETGNGWLDIYFAESDINVSVAGSYQSEGFEFGLVGHEADGVWSGEVLFAALEDGVSTPQMSGSYTLVQGRFEADLNLMDIVPVALRADWTDAALSAKLDTGELGQTAEFALDTDPDHFRLSLDTANNGELLSGFFLTSDVQDGLRHTEIGSRGTAVPGGEPKLTLDSRLDHLDDGWRYDLLFCTVEDGAQRVSVALTGEDHYSLDMSRSAPYTLSQRGDISVKLEGDAGVTGSYALDHRVRVDERKHREPKAPERIRLVDGEPEPSRDAMTGAEPEAEEEPEPQIEEEPEPQVGAEAWPQEPPAPTLRPVKSLKG